MNNNIQSKLAIIFSSGATWTLIATIVVNTINANAAILPAGVMPYLNVVLLMASMYLHGAKVQNAAVMGSTKA